MKVDHVAVTILAQPFPDRQERLPASARSETASRPDQGTAFKGRPETGSGVALLGLGFLLELLGPLGVLDAADPGDEADEPSEK